MRKVLMLILALFIALVSCENDESQILSINEIDCPLNLFYYVGNEKIQLDSLLLFDHLLVGFDTITSDIAINEFLNSQAVFNTDTVTGIREYPHYDKKWIIKELAHSKNCYELVEIIKNINSYEIVSFTHCTYESKAWLGEIYCNIMIYSDRFLVLLKNANDLDSLNSIVSQTNTKIISKDRSWENGYIISADKNSQGNALKMSVFFDETNQFEWTSLSFFDYVIE